MVKHTLDKFSLILEGGERVPCAPPFSLASFSESVRERVSSEGVVFEAELFFTKEDLASRYVFLRLTDLQVPSTVSVNGNTLGGSDGLRRDLTLDIKGALAQGANTLSLAFEATDAAGIYGKAEIIRTDSAVIDRVSLCTVRDGAKMHVSVKISTLGQEGVRAVATLVSGAGHIYYAGIIKSKGRITVNDPLYWWPRGIGMQNLYKLTVNLYGEQEIEDTYEMRVGLRTLVTSKSADGSLLDANGTPFLPMGALYRHSTAAAPEVRNRKMEALIASAARANFNTLVIPDGTPSLPDRFYELCDSHGIVVIHEITKLGDAERAIIARSSNHPSIGLLDLIGLGDGIEEIAEEIRSINPELDFSILEARPEYLEIPALPTERTLLERFPEGVNLFSEEMEHAVGGSTLPFVVQASKDFLYAGSTAGLAYASGLSAGREITRWLSEARINRTRRAIFSFIGTDGFADGSSLDSMARWKSLHYLVARAFSQTLVYATAVGGAVSFFVSNERRLDFTGEIEYRILDNENRKIYGITEPIRVPESASTRLFVRDLSSYVLGYEKERYLEYLIREGTSVVSRGVLLFTEPKNFGFLDPKIKAEIVGDDRRFSVTLTAEAFASGVELSFSNTDALFSDNCLELTSGAPVKISFSVLGRSTSARLLGETLKIKSVYNIGKETHE